jgi:hypothetical protein
MSSYCRTYPMKNQTAFLIVWIVFIVILLYSNTYSESFQDRIHPLPPSPSKIRFLTSKETRYVLLSDKDHYYKGFSKYDLIARNINTVEEYKEHIKETPVNPTENQKRYLTNCIHDIHKRLANISMDGLDRQKFLSIPLNIGIVSGENYENGLAHTRGNVIILSEKIVDTYPTKRLSGTMSHEMMHIYQKQFPEEVSVYLNANQIQEDMETLHDPLRRANPDLNNVLYRDKDGEPYYAKYTNEKPTGVGDVVYSQQKDQEREHPFEQMAIEFEKKNF